MNIVRWPAGRSWGLVILLTLLVLPGAVDATAQADDAALIRIELDRSACFGSCPDYRLIIEGSGQVTFEGRSSVLVPGRMQWRIDPEQVSALARRFEEAGFFRLRDEYSSQVSDVPTYRLTIRASSRTKTVVDYLGREAGMPAAVTELELLVDQVGQSRRGVEGDEHTVGLLREGGWNFRSQRSAAMMVWAAGGGNMRVVQDLHAAGVPLTARAGDMTAIEAAAWGGRFETWQFLRSSGALPPDQPDLHARVAKAAVMTGNARILRAMLPFQFDVNAGNQLLLGEAMGVDCEEAPECNRAAVIRTLLEGGADPNRPDDHGSTSLHYAQSVGEARMLVEAGANVNVLDFEGQTPAMVMCCGWEDIIIYLLDAGTDASIRSVHGETLADIARRSNLPRVLARLSAQ